RAAGREDLLLGAEARRPLVREGEVGLADRVHEPADLVGLDRMAQADLLALLQGHQDLHVAPDEDDLEVLVGLAQHDACGALLHDPSALGRIDDVVTHLEGHSGEQSNTGTPLTPTPSWRSARRRRRSWPPSRGSSRPSR